MSAYIGLIKAAIILALLVALSAFVWRAGANSVQVKWRAADATRAEAEKVAVLNRINENQEIFRKQERDNTRITKAHDDEIAAVRAAINSAPRMRVPRALCNQPAVAAETESTGGSNETHPRGGLVREDIERDIRALKLRVEEAFAAGRAAQDFIQSNGMAP